MDGAALEWIIDAVLAALVRDEEVEPLALIFLLRCYRLTDRADVREALEPALARAVERQACAATTTERASWLTLFTDAVTLSDDERIRSTAIDLTVALRAAWGHTTSVAEGAVSVDACLSASHLLDGAGLMPAAIDELERIIGGAYRPGEGLAHDLNMPAGMRGLFSDQVRASSVLLDACELTGRIPYGMLAEELMQFARRTLWDDANGVFYDARVTPADSFLLNCEAAHVLTKLAGLHQDEEYRAAAVLAEQADYAQDAERILNANASFYRNPGLSSAAYGLALVERFG
jgi:hypothetical protein